MEIVVLVKGVPDFREGKVQFKEDNTLNRSATPTVLNPNDHFALEAARELQVKHGGTVHVITMGPPNYDVILKEALEYAGDKVYLLSDRELGGADTWATAWTLSTAIRKIGPADLILAGFKSADGETGQTGPQTALLLDRPIVTHATKLEVFPEEGRFRAERLTEDEVEVCEAPLPGFIVTDPGFLSTYTKASDRLKLLDHQEAQREKMGRHKELMTLWNREALGVGKENVGLTGSPTIVRKVEPIPRAPASRHATVLDASDESIRRLAKMIVEKAGA